MIAVVNHCPFSLKLPAVGKSASVLLAPGKNDVDADQWNALKGDVPVKDWIAGSLLAEVVDKSDEKPADPKSLVELTPAKAVEFINTTKDVDLLVSMRKDEKRPQVVQVLERRLESLKATADK